MSEHSDRVAAMVAALVKASPLIDGSTAGEIRITWLDGSGLAVQTVIDGPWSPPADWLDREGRPA